MTPFKEPQPRKTPEGGTPVVPKGVSPPYARLGNEARWEDGAKESLRARVEPENAPDEMREWKPEAAPLMILPDHSPFELRKAALEAACGFHEDGDHNSLFWENLQTFENYLRDGTKPS